MLFVGLNAELTREVGQTASESNWIRDNFGTFL